MILCCIIYDYITDSPTTNHQNIYFNFANIFIQTHEHELKLFLDASLAKAIEDTKVYATDINFFI